MASDLQKRVVMRFVKMRREERANQFSLNLFAAAAVILVLLPLTIHATTDQSDIQSLEIIYSSLNSPPQLSGWKSSGGDPCGESWKGISCSGPSVIAIQIPGLGLNGTMGYMLSNLLSLRTMDLSNNNIHDTVPYQLPPNLTHLDLAGNNLSGNLPYSLSIMASLSYLNVSHNSLSQLIGDLFTNHQDLSVLDLSFNNFSGDLPNSFSSLSNLSTLYLQNNQLTGPVDLLAGLPLSDLNIENNHFNGWIPPEFSSISNLRIGGNSFDAGPAPPPPPYTPPPPDTRSHNGHNGSGKPTPSPRGSEGKGSQSAGDNNEGRLAAGAIVGIVMGSILVTVGAVVAVVFCLRKFPKRKVAKENSINLSLGSVSVIADEGNKAIQEQRVKVGTSITNLNPPPAEKLVGERVPGKNGTGKRPKSPITATSYTVAQLQTATNSFSQEFLVGEGSLGRVYRADFSNGKVLAIKKIDSSALSLQEEDNFLEAVSNMSRLRHPNITTLLGYCVEHGQRLLVYEYFGNGTLHDMLHFSDDSSKTLNWNARVKIALGTARALEYLHEVCLPSVVHRNFKSANILLDEELSPHLSDCGLAALTPNTERQVSTQLWSTSAAAFMAWLHCWELRDRGYKPVEDENFLTKEFLETNIDWIPGMPNLRLKDMPSFVRTMDPQDIFYLEFVTGEMRNAFKSSALILNTFDELEIEILTAIRSKYQELYTVGPLSMLCRHLPETPLNSMGLTLWEGSCASVEWLNRWEAGSVLYVNFGSVSLLTNQQLIEFAWGLANSNQPFMWVIRPDLVIGEAAALPPDFTEEIKERGLIVSWCSQEQVLNHPSVGGFLTHCGWNSTMESVCAGVPMICWPFWSDQPTNCKYICSEWKLGMEIDSKVKREEVAGLVRELMVGKKGIEMRMNAKKWKKSALDATELDGSSYLNLSKFCSGLPVGKQPDSDGKY